MEPQTNQEQKSSNSNLYLGLVIIFLLAVAYFFIKKPTTQTQTSSSTPPVAVENNQQPPTSEATSSATQATVTIEGGSFYFKPNEITAKVGEPVTITFNNSEGVHDFRIDEFNVNSGIIAGGKNVTFSFTPDRAGTFEFYCSVGSHRQMGMKGTLVVK